MTALIICSLLVLFAFAGTAGADENYSEDIVSEIRGFLLDDDWKFDFDDEKGIFRFGVNIDGKMKHVNYFMPVRDDSYTVYAISPVSGDPEDPLTMSAIADFVCRANYGLRNGNFEVDMTDGEIRYKVFVECDGIVPSREIIRGSIIIPAMMFERYSPGLLDVIFKGVSAADAIAKCEN